MLDWLRLLLTIFSSLFQWRQKEEEYELNFGREGYFFNPTFFIYEDKIRFITRTVIEKHRHIISSYIGLDEVTQKKTTLEMQSIKSLEVDNDWPADPRYFMYNSKRYITFNSGHFERPNKLYLQEVSEECSLIGVPIELKFNDRHEIEKNWSFFEKDGQLYTVYSVHPFRVLKVELNFVKSEAVCYDHVTYLWNIDNYTNKYGELRGGCSPVEYGESYFFVVQSNVLVLGKSIYTANLIQFNKNTFEPEKIGERPIFLMTFRQVFMKPLKMLNKRVFSCIYPAGMQFSDGEKLLIAFGINDYKAVIRRYSINNVFSLLTKNIKVIND